MRRLERGQRVRVRVEANGGRDVDRIGHVVRPRRADDAAWISLLERHPNPHVHPFPADDPHGRATHVVAFPEDCELAARA